MAIYAVTQEETTTFLVEADSQEEAIRKFEEDEEDRKEFSYLSCIKKCEVHQ